MKCFYCGEDIAREIIDGINVYDFTVIPLDRPYANLPIHRRKCLPVIQGGLSSYLENNIERVYEYVVEIKGNGLKDKKTKRKGASV